ncbi:hypothetical protein IQ279_15320 [Streptomyces verrucosisporus]|uniref:hypothetical protein n=1 Tax=Streptomyces verrucosisporus TaxID=1695161 RepID=UPI0019D2BB55|nr:hypothetical protein [Streptomyces verrucosisporus]MBN3930984.1 hypothetical protein [Streptomyces verrucosisporus]
MSAAPLPRRGTPDEVIELPADTPGDRLNGRACVHCGTRGEPLAYIGWARVATGRPGGHLSCPVSACADCRARRARQPTR